MVKKVRSQPAPIAQLKNGKKETTSEAPRLPRQRAFVVQFEGQIEETPRRFSGRVEHVVSGQTVRFGSQKELLDFFQQVLQAQDDA